MAKNDVKASLTMNLEWLGKPVARRAIEDIKKIEKAAEKIGQAKSGIQGQKLSVEKTQAMVVRGAMNTQKAVASIEAKGIENRKAMEIKAENDKHAIKERNTQRYLDRVQKRELADMAEKNRMLRHNDNLALRTTTQKQREAALAVRDEERKADRAQRAWDRMVKQERQARKDKEREEDRAARETRRRQREKDRAEAKAARDAKRRADEEARALRRQFQEEKRILTELRRMDKERARARKEFYDRFGGSVGRASAVTSGAILGTGAAAINSHLGMSKGVASVLTLNTDLSEKQINELAKATMRNYGFDTDTTTKAMYDITSSGFGADGKLQPVLEASSKLAVGGNTDISSAASGLVATLNAWDLGADKATEVTDLFFQAMSDGSTTIQQLSENMGKIGAMAKLTNISIPEVFSFVDLATKTGTKTETAVTGTSQMISSIIQNKDNKKSKAAARKLGVKLGAKGLSETPGGLAGWMDTVLRSEHYSVDLLKDIFTDIDGFRVAASLARFGPDEIQKMLASQSGATKGQATKVAFDKIANSDAFQAQQVYADFQVAMIELGEVLVPIVKEYLPGLKKGLAEWHEELKNPATRELIVNLTKYGLLLSGGGLVMSGTMNLVSTTREVAGALSSMLGRGSGFERELLAMRANLNGTSLAVGGSDGLNRRLGLVNAALSGKEGVADNLKHFGSIAGKRGAAGELDELNRALRGNRGVVGQMDLLGGSGGKIALTIAALEGLRRTAIWLDKQPDEEKAQNERIEQGKAEQSLVDAKHQNTAEMKAKALANLKAIQADLLDEKQSPSKILKNVLRGFGLVKGEMQVKKLERDLADARKLYDERRREHERYLKTGQAEYQDLKARDTGSATEGTWIDPDDWRVQYHRERLQREKELAMSGLDIQWPISDMWQSQENGILALAREQAEFEALERSALASIDRNFAPSKSNVELDGEIRIVVEDRRAPQVSIVSAREQANKILKLLTVNAGRTAPY